MIGVFDSGYGGLTVFRELDKKFPKYDFIYFGDNARAPYGSRSAETIYQYTKECVDWLFKEGCGLVILACNTASATALRKIQQEYLPANFPEKRVLGVLIPVASSVAEAMEDKEAVGILATEATVKSESYIREVKKFKPDAKIIQVAAPLLVPLIEEGKIDDPITRRILQEYLADFKKENIKNIVLGCTHYPFIKHLIQAEMPNAKIFDSPSVIPAALENYLSRHPEIEQKLSKNGSRRYVTTGDQENFEKFARENNLFLSTSSRVEKYP
ncbi:MAG: glutamate racemase [bacterium]|nr:glutamate racemase [bacterium]